MEVQDTHAKAKWAQSLGVSKSGYNAWLETRDERYKNLTRDLTVNRPFQVLSSDISYIRTGEGFDYLCQIRDVYSNTVLASLQQERMTKELVIKTMQSVKQRWHIPEGTIFHADRGSQYTSKEVQQCAAQYGWQQSFSRVCKPGDNAWSESFFALLKKELVHGANFKTREEARDKVFGYIYDFYNPTRKQKSLGYLSPHEFVNTLEPKALARVA